MNTPRTRLRAIEKRLRTTGVVPPEIVHDPRVSVSLPWVVRKFARQSTGRCAGNAHGPRQVTWDQSQRCWIDIATGRPSDEVTAESVRAVICDLDARWRASGNFHVALRAWTDEGVDLSTPLYPACQWKERGYARFRRWLGHERSVTAGEPRRDDVDWSRDFEGEARDLEELAILGWEDGLDLTDWRFTYRLS